MTDEQRQGLTADELDAQVGEELPDREAMSVLPIDAGIGAAPVDELVPPPGHDI